MSRTVVAIAALCVCASPYFVAAGQPKITSLTSALGQQGTSFQVQVSGEGLSEQCDFVFYEEGLKCTQVSLEDGKLTATLEATSDCRIGRHAFQIYSNEGVSNVRSLSVLDREVCAEQEPNTSAKEAQAAVLGQSILATLESDDVDCFRVKLEAGQRLSAEVEAIRLAYKLMDLKLTVIGPSGASVAYSDDTSLGKQDPYLTFLADEAGDYIVRVESSGVDGSDDSSYLLHLGAFPRPDFLFPPGAQVGKPVDVKLLGDSTLEWTERLTFSAPGTHEYYPMRDGNRAPTPIPFRASEFPNVLEQEPNGDPRDVAVGEDENLPLAFNGVLQEPGDLDYFRFSVTSNAPIEFATYASRVASPADTIIRIFDLSGTELCSNDDRAGLDSGLIWTPPSAGDYLVRIEEKRRAGGPRFVYRIEAREVAPAVVAFLPRRLRDPSAQAISIPKGNRVLEFVGVKRQRWFGKAELGLQGLPQEVTASFGVVKSDQYATPVVLEAASETETGVNLVRLSARSLLVSPTIEGGFEQPIDLVAASADRLYQGMRLDQLPIAVVEPAKVKIDLVVPPCPIPRDSTFRVNVVVDRAPEFAGDVEVKMTYLPEWMDAPEKITIPAGESQGSIELTARPEIADCTWPFVAQARAMPPATETDSSDSQMRQRIPGRRQRSSTSSEIEVASEIVPVGVGASPVSAKPSRWLGARGSEIKIAFPLAYSGKVPNVFTAVLTGLPAKVTAQDSQLNTDSGEVVFNVTIPDDAPLGEFASLLCELSGELEEHRITYRVGRSSILKIVPPEELLTDERGKPLSPLEILRQQPVSLEAAETETRSPN